MQAGWLILTCLPGCCSSLYSLPTSADLSDATLAACKPSCHINSNKEKGNHSLIFSGCSPLTIIAILLCLLYRLYYASVRVACDDDAPLL